MNPTLMHEIARHRMADNLRAAENARLAKEAKANGYKLTERAVAKVAHWLTTPEAEPNSQFEVQSA